jgi:hypothetical protein
MHIPKTSLTTYAREQHCTLQIPDIVLGDDSNIEYIVIPDDWVGRRYDGCLFFTRKGYEACKADLKFAFEHPITNRGYSWIQFERAAKEFLTKNENKLKVKKGIKQ